jgi:hypothetical protein
VHHAIDVGDDGTIYAITQQVVHERPAGLRFVPTPYLADYLVLLSPDGKELQKIPLLEAFRDSPYAALLTTRPQFEDKAWDVLHTNCVEVLSSKLAAQFPMFQPGQVLISVRELDALAMLDPQSGKVIWAARGPWMRQHGTHFLDNGRLLMFDNRGAASAARVLEYDPRDQSFPWSYPGVNDAPLVNEQQGECQRLPNGNTLIVISNEGALLEVTPDRELVWAATLHAHVPWARRYAADQLKFLKGDQRARP